MAVLITHPMKVKKFNLKSKLFNTLPVYKGCTFLRCIEVHFATTCPIRTIGNPKSSFISSFLDEVKKYGLQNKVLAVTIVSGLGYTMTYISYSMSAPNKLTDLQNKVLTLNI